MLKTSTATLLTASAALLFGQAAVAADLAVYATFPDDGNQERASIAGTSAESGITPGALTRSAELLPSAASNAFNSKGWASNVDGTPTVLNEDAFVELSFSVDTGFTATLDELLFGSRSSTSGPSLIGVYTSADAFTTPIATINEDSGFSNNRLDLSTVGAITGDFAVRFYNDGGTTPASPSEDPPEFDMDEDSTWRVSSLFEDGGFVTDGVVVTGTVSAIPEPASLALVALGGTALLARRRTRG